MSKTDLIHALGLMLMLEGILPLLLPQAWRQTFHQLLQLRDGQLRFIGLIAVLAGLVFLLLA